MSNIPPQRVSSGEKFRNEHGMTVIKDGMKQRKAQAEAPSLERKPKWLRAQIPGGERFERVLEQRYGDHHAYGVSMHPRLSILRGRYRQPTRLARS